MSYDVILTHKAEEDLKELIKQGYGKKIEELVKILKKTYIKILPNTKAILGK